MQTLDLGEVAPISSKWWKDDGVADEPSAITLTITKPDGTVIVVNKGAMTGSESGALAGTEDQWTYGQALDQIGLWRYTPSGVVDGAPVTQVEQVFLVGTFSASQAGPCEQWCTWPEVEACSRADFTSLDAAARDVSLDIASEILFNLDDRLYAGICTAMRTLCLSCASCWPGVCSCDPINGIDLGGRTPVWGAWDVVVDGVTLPPSAYKIVGRRYLTRIDGLSWPTGTDVADPNTFRATWAYGRVIPPGARRAAALFVAEIAKGCMGVECEIPKRITSIVREGVTYPVIDSMKMIAEGRTGVALTDLWIVADKAGRKPKPGMFSPAAHGVRRIS